MAHFLPLYKYLHVPSANIEGGGAYGLYCSHVSIFMYRTHFCCSFIGSLSVCSSSGGLPDPSGMEPGGGRLPVQVLGENEALQQFFSGEMMSHQEDVVE